MKKIFSLLLFILASCCHITYSQTAFQADIQRWEQQAQRVEIIRDSWGVPHIYGKTDADVVFGLLYTQCEDDFQRVEANYIDAIGRMAEVRGEAYLWHDLRARMFLDSTQAKAIYQKSPKWLKKLCDAFADGINYYLYKNPEVKPQLITRFQPWMPIMFSEGSIGGNITVVSTRRIQQFYENTAIGKIEEEDPLEEKLAGSNGFAIAPSNSASGNSFIAVVEFGDRLKARSIVSGGQSNNPASPHFDDQASMFCNGVFKTVNFYREDVEKNAERIYRPGE